jgi:hypothetical protein
MSSDAIVKKRKCKACGGEEVVREYDTKERASKNMPYQVQCTKCKRWYDCNII